MSAKAKAAAPWQKGLELDEIKRHTALYREHDEGHIYGAFTGIGDLQVVEWLHSGRMVSMTTRGQLVGAYAERHATQRQQVADYTSRVRAEVVPGDCYVKRVAYTTGTGYTRVASGLAKLLKQVQLGGGALWLEVLQEHRGDLELCKYLGLTRVCSKIPAGGEVLGVYRSGRPAGWQALPAEDEYGLRRLPLKFDPAPYAAAVARLSQDDFALHYSSKQKAGAWAALALRGYGPPGGPADPTFIAKPAEMAKRWKAENAEVVDTWVLQNTPLRRRMRALEPLVALVPGKHHRVRLMRLEPGGGELTRHADNTDPDAGLLPGHLARVHLPIVTNPGVQFEAWLADGKCQRRNMAAGEVWTLDTLKPHRAVNGGTEARVHLVIDTEVSDELRTLMRAGS